MMEPQAPSMSASSEVLISWHELLDGKLRRLQRGVHFRGPAKAIEEVARQAALEHARTAVTFRDRFRRSEYLWVQFLHGNLGLGEPCTSCGSRSLVRIHTYMLRCQDCAARFRLAYRPPHLGAVTEEPKKEDRPTSEQAAEEIGPTREEVAEFVDVRLLSAHGERIEEISFLEEAVVEATCRFSRAVADAEARLIFLRDGEKVLPAVCPQPITVPGPESVRIALGIPPRRLRPGDYAVTLAAVITLEAGDESTLVVRSPEALSFQVYDPRRPAGEQRRARRRRERPPLKWSVVSVPEHDSGPREEA
jgi:hypothetical protein